MPRTVLLYALLLPLLMAGCGRPVTPMPLKTPTLKSPAPTFTVTPAFAFTPSLPATDDEWDIKMTHSGGIMGLMRSIEVSSDGNYTVMDERSNKTITEKLSASELSKLEEIVLSTKFVAPERGSSVCADCFIYDLEIQKDGKRFKIQVDDISMPNSGMEPLITYLREIIDTALK
jgi:hypothetical protein